MNILCGAVVVGGGYYDVFDLSSYELLRGWQQCSGSALAVEWQQWAAWGRCWQRGGGGSRAVAAQQRQHGNGSVAVVAVWRQQGGGQGGGVGQCGGSAVEGSVAAVLASWQRWHWQHANSGRLGGCGGSLAAS
jgi:hypothetical protein